MNPADVAQSALPLASADVSILSLFLQAHWVVKSVMIGLLILQRPFDWLHTAAMASVPACASLRA